MLLSLSIILSDILRLCSAFLLRNKALAIGTYVSERIKAPSIAKNTVIAIGLNIFPSIPTKVKRGM